MYSKSSGKGLGKGLGALLGDAGVAERESGSVFLRITDVEPNMSQPRKVFDEVALNELAESIRRHGILQPLAVRKLPTGYYQIIAGERRWRAARMAGLEQIPAMVFEADDQRATELALIENLQREDLNPVEEAEGYRTLIDQYGLTQEEVSIQVGRSRPAVANALRLLALSRSALELLSSGEISGGHARALLSLNDAAKQTSIAKKTVAEGLSVRQVESLVRKILENERKEAAPEEAKGLTVNYLEELEKQLASRLGRKIKIVNGRKRGRVEVEFYGEDDLSRLTDLLMRL